MTVAPTSPPTNLLTIDVEDWYQLAGEIVGGRTDSRPEILERQLDRLLALLASHKTRATFFCLGRSLAPFPHLVRRIADAGHEIGTHGWGHQRISQIGLEAFREDLRRSVDWLQELLGAPVLGHRAAAFSVAAEQLEGFYDICFEQGLRYDSSVFPIRGRRYGIPDARREAHVVRADGPRRLVEVPLATVEMGGRRFPVAGGGWWRIMPLWAVRAAIARVGREGLPFTTYLHPYEFDTQRLDVSQLAARSPRALRFGFAQNLRRGTVYRKLDALLPRFRFGAIEDYLRAVGHF